MILGYGLATEGEADRRMEATLKEFKRLTDHTIILLNNASHKEKALVERYGFDWVEDNREWGKLQWKIKEDFVSTYVATSGADLCICLDMDEVLDEAFTRTQALDLIEHEASAFYVYIVNLRDGGYASPLSFWNIRIWKPVQEYGFTFPHKALHCGLAPEWVWSAGYYIPHILYHHGMATPETRKRKVERYTKYDPTAQYMGKSYYDALSGGVEITDFDYTVVKKEVMDFVSNLNQKPKKPMRQKEEKYVIVLRKDGVKLDIPERHLEDALSRGFTLVSRDVVTKENYQQQAIAEKITPWSSSMSGSSAPTTPSDTLPTASKPSVIKSSAKKRAATKKVSKGTSAKRTFSSRAKSAPDTTSETPSDASDPQEPQL